MDKKEQIQLQQAVKGKFKIYLEKDPKQILFQKDNLIVNGISYIFARLMASNTEPTAGVWGLAVGTGSSGWSQDTQPAPVATTYALIAQVLRKPLSSVVYLDGSGNPLAAGTLSTNVEFQITLNATTDSLANVALREFGLISGGTNSSYNGGPTSNVLTAPFFNPASPSYNTVTLLNYLTTTPFILPVGLNVVISWTLTF